MVEYRFCFDFFAKNWDALPIRLKDVKRIQPARKGYNRLGILVFYIGSKIVFVFVGILQSSLPKE